MPVTSAAPPAGYYLVWSDEFNGASLDTAKWDYWLLGNRRDAVNTASAVSLNGSNLVITTYTSGGTHYTAMVATDGKFRSRYGYWESSIKWSDTNGMWSAFWMQSPTMGSYLSDPQVSGSEIDMAEHRYVDGSGNNIANQVQVNIHWNGYGSAARSSGSGNVGSGLAGGFHTYGFLWTPNAYSFQIDGSQVYNGGSSPVSLSTEWAILSSEVDDTSTTWAGYIPAGGYGDQNTSAARLSVDYVRFYAPTNTLFWTGAGDAIDLGNSANYVSNLPPLAASDLTFSMLSGNNLSPMLNGNLAVNGLVFLWMNNGTSVNGINTLTLGAGGIDMAAANHTVNINCPVNVGANQTWSVGPNSPGNTLLVNGAISGTAALTKDNWGMLILNGTNPFSGTLNIDTSATGTEGVPHYSGGITRLTRSENVAAVPAIAIRNNNNAWSTLQLTNLLANLTIPAAVTLNGRNTNVPAIQNLSGSNTLAGGLTINVGGGLYLLQSDLGTLNLGGVIASAASGTRTLAFQGNGNFYISGSIQNGSASVINLSKTNAGSLTVSGANSFSGATTNWRGSLIVNGSLSSSLAVVSGTLGGNGSIGGATTIQPGATLAPGNAGIGTLSLGSSLTLAPGSTSVMELNKTGHTNDVLAVNGILNCGGTLVLANLGGNLAAGDTFKLFNAGAYHGAFASLSPAAPGPGLTWNTNTLTIDGVLRIVAAAPPVINSAGPSGDGFVLSIGGGPPGSPFRVFTATNLLVPLTNWTPVWTDAFDLSGAGQFTGSFSRSAPLQLFNVAVP